MKTCVAVVVLLFSGFCFAQNQGAYPGVGGGSGMAGARSELCAQGSQGPDAEQGPCVERTHRHCHGRGWRSSGAIDLRFANSSWRAILIEEFGRGAAAFPGEIILVDAKFVRTLQLNDDELALILSHEAAHVVAGHASRKLSFMAEFLGKEKVPTARTALLEFLAKDSYAAVFQPTARLQEREADMIGAAIFFASGYDSQRALRLFDKLAQLETRDNGRATDSHDAARVRKQAVAGVIAELQQFHARRGPEPR